LSIIAIIVEHGLHCSSICKKPIAAKKIILSKQKLTLGIKEWKKKKETSEYTSRPP